MALSEVISPLGHWWARYSNHANYANLVVHNDPLVGSVIVSGHFGHWWARYANQANYANHANLMAHTNPLARSVIVRR